MDVFEKINELYKNDTYYSQYGGSMFITFITLVIFVIAYIYLKFQVQKKYYRATWGKNKCSPSVLPFAGEIGANKGESKVLFAANNFMECNKNILSNIVQNAVSPLFYSVQMFSTVLLSVSTAVNSMRQKLKTIINMFANIANWIYQKLILILLPIKIMMLNAQQINNKFAAVLSTILYNIINIYDSIRSIFGLMVKVLVLILTLIVSALVATGAIAGFWNPFAMILFLIMFIAFIVWFNKAGPIIFFLTKAFSVMTPNMPSRRSKSSFLSCFDSDTVINTINGNIPINSIKVGDKLIDNSYVTCVMKLINNEDMYSLNGIKVTSSHKVLFNNKYINVSKHPNAKLISTYNKKYVYCLNTSNKIIKINNHTFLDWDEIEEHDLLLLNKYNYFNDISYINIHKYLDSGFHMDTPICMNNGKYISIKDINIGDMLYNNNKVIGIVKILANDINTYKQYNINNHVILGSNLTIDTHDINILKDLLINNKDINPPTYIYNLLTEDKTIHIHGYNYDCYDSILYNIFENTDKHFSQF